MAVEIDAGAIGAFLDADHPRQIAFLAGRVQCPSDNPAGDCLPHAQSTRDALQALGLEVQMHTVPDEAVRAVGMKSCANLIVRHRFGPGPTIALNAHGDVVPPGEGWTHDPYGAQVVVDPEHGPTMFGRGVAVSKSDFATYTWALLALRHAGLARGTVEIHYTHDEESGGEIGPKWILENGLSRPDYAISAGFSYGIVTAHNGCLHHEVTVQGRQAHAAMPQTGLDALEAATQILQALYDYRAELAGRRSGVPGIESPTLNVGLIAGGINTNVVPDQVRFRLDRRIIPEEAHQPVEAQLLDVIQGAAAHCRPGIQVSSRRILWAQPLAALPGSEALVEALRGPAERLFGTAIPTHGVPLYTDARHYAAQGIPTVLYGAGPRTVLEARGHNADENLRLRDLRRATQVVALACADLLSR
jgi:acetylornithine deacetylase/succinyl-diaminopimelate desuccinylase-like protein